MKQSDKEKKEREETLDYLKMLELLKYQPIPNQNDINFINLVTDLYSKHGRLYISICIFHYGLMKGIKSERARKKRS
ncbi:hypothetical protein C8E03_11419 [Lachnotalea glycerini]|uniref:Uncharacterized protein n=1 Tax=Lachnotalea glycerini TaxID=1763509 RepID=A0A255I7P8_9FIRM|nr:hypothetical protein [Lachnotalea glycerini]PXV85942.1 hypothetical protein C8E03_11419 [Lachnotalea glycerini]RDY31378.1 hypothetical protein CG710_009665 [Lachnotalea glycerini]